MVDPEFLLKTAFALFAQAKVVLLDKYNAGKSEWACAKGCLRGGAVSFSWMPLEEYVQNKVLS